MRLVRGIHIVSDHTMRVLTSARAYVAHRHLSGDGIEIGALDHPTPLSKGCRVRYVDRATKIELERSYPEVTGPISEPDIIDDGERLATIDDASLDFIVANHFIEHCENPIGTLERFHATLRPGGCVMLAVPWRDRTFDVARPVTTLEHLMVDYRSAGVASRARHFREWVALVERCPVDDVETRARQLDAENYSIHFHCWNPEDFVRVLEVAGREGGAQLSLETLLANNGEFIVLARKPAGRS